MRALSTGGRDLDVMRIVAWAGIDPPEGWARFAVRFDRIRADAVRVLKANVPRVKDRELILRTRLAAGLLNWVALAPVGAELRNRSERQIERQLVPALPEPSAAPASADGRDLTSALLGSTCPQSRPERNGTSGMHLRAVAEVEPDRLHHLERRA